MRSGRAVDILLDLDTAREIRHESMSAGSDAPCLVEAGHRIAKASAQRLARFADDDPRAVVGP